MYPRITFDLFVVCLLWKFFLDPGQMTSMFIYFAACVFLGCFVPYLNIFKDNVH